VAFTNQRLLRTHQRIVDEIGDRAKEVFAAMQAGRKA
jgi:hypothetical protein